MDPLTPHRPKTSSTRQGNGARASQLPWSARQAVTMARDGLSKARVAAARSDWHEADAPAAFAGVLFAEETLARERLLDREQGERVAISTLCSREGSSRIFEPHRQAVSIAEAHDRAQLHRLANMEFRLFAGQFRQELIRVPTAPSTTTLVPTPPESTSSRPPSGWLARHTPVMQLPSADDVVSDESIARGILVAEAAEELGRTKESERLDHQRTTNAWRQRQHNARLSQWRDERESRERRERSFASGLLQARMLKASEADERKRIGSEQAVEFGECIRQIEQTRAGLQQSAVLRLATRARSQSFSDMFIPLCIGSLVELEQNVRQSRWLEERVNEDLELFRDRAAELRSLYLKSLYLRDSVLRIQRFYRRVKSGFVGWRRSHRVAGDCIRARRRQVELNRTRLHIREQVAAARAELVDAYDEEAEARVSQLEQLVAVESAARDEVGSEERWWLLNVLEVARMAAVQIVLPLLRETAQNEELVRTVTVSDELESWAVLSRSAAMERLVLAHSEHMSIIECDARQALYEDEASQFESSIQGVFGQAVAELLAKQVAEAASEGDRKLRQLHSSEASGRCQIAEEETAAFTGTFQHGRLHGPLIDALFTDSLRQQRFWSLFSRGLSAIFVESALDAHVVLSSQGLADTRSAAQQFQRHAVLTDETVQRDFIVQREGRLRQSLCGPLFREVTLQLIAYVELRDRAARRIQLALRDRRTGVLGHRGAMRYLRETFKSKHEHALLRRQHQMLRNVVVESRAELDAAVAENNAAAGDVFRRNALQLSRDEGWARKSIRDEEAFVWRISCRNLSDCLLDIVDDWISSSKEAEWLGRRGLMKQEAEQWERLQRASVDHTLDVAIRPAQRAARCFLARKVRRQKIDERLNELPAEENARRQHLTVEGMLALVHLHRDHIVGPAAAQERVEGCRIALETLASSVRSSIIAEFTAAVARMIGEDEHRRRRSLRNEEQADFDTITGRRRHEALRQVDLCCVESAERYLLASTECSVRVHQFVECHEAVVREEFESRTLAADLPRLQMELAESIARVTLVSTGEFEHRTSLLTDIESLDRWVLQATEDVERVAVDIVQHESVKRADIEYQRSTALAQTANEEQQCMRAHIECEEKEMRDQLRVVRAESDARLAHENARLQLLLGSMEEFESGARRAVCTSLCLSEFVATAEAVETSFQEKVALYSAAIADEGKLDVLTHVEECWRQQVDDEWRHALSGLHRNHHREGFDALLATETRERSEVAIAERRWRGTVSSALEHRGAHAAARVLQLAWTRHKQRGDPTYLPGSAREPLRQLSATALADHERLASSLSADVSVALLCENEHVRRCLVGAEQRDATSALHATCSEIVRTCLLEEEHARTQARAHTSGAEEAERASIEQSERSLRVNWNAACLQSEITMVAALADQEMRAQLLKEWVDYEDSARQRLSSSEQADRGCFIATEAAQRISNDIVQQQEARGRRELEASMAQEFATIEHLYASAVDEQEALTREEFEARASLEANEQDSRTTLVCHHHEGLGMVARAKRISACKVLQRWWHTRSISNAEMAAIAEAVYMRDTLAADLDAALELRNFAEAVNASVVVIQACYRSFRLRRSWLRQTQSRTNSPAQRESSSHSSSSSSEFNLEDGSE